MKENSAVFFADTSKIEEIRKLQEIVPIGGITTNPIIVAKEANQLGADVTNYYFKLASEFADIPVSIQLLDEELPTLIAQARDFAAISPNVVVKVPMFGDGRGLAVIKKLSQENPEIKINVTALMSVEQALMALMASSQRKTGSVEYVSLFFNRIKDGGANPTREIEKTRKFLTFLRSRSQIITGSIRKSEDIYQAIVAGTHIVTVPPARVWDMVKHPQSIRFIDEAQKEWGKMLKGK